MSAGSRVLTSLVRVEGHQIGAGSDVVPLAGEGAGSDVVDPFLRRMKQNVSRRRPGQAREPDVPAQERSQTVVPEESQRARGDFVSRNQRGKPKRASSVPVKTTRAHAACTGPLKAQERFLFFLFQDIRVMFRNESFSLRFST